MQDPSSGRLAWTGLSRRSLRLITTVLGLIVVALFAMSTVKSTPGWLYFAAFAVGVAVLMLLGMLGAERVAAELREDGLHIVHGPASSAARLAGRGDRLIPFARITRLTVTTATDTGAASGVLHVAGGPAVNMDLGTNNAALEPFIAALRSAVPALAAPPVHRDITGGAKRASTVTEYGATSKTGDTDVTLTTIDYTPHMLIFVERNWVAIFATIVVLMLLGFVQSAIPTTPLMITAALLMLVLALTPIVTVARVAMAASRSRETRLALGTDTLRISHDGGAEEALRYDGMASVRSLGTLTIIAMRDGRRVSLLPMQAGESRDALVYAKQILRERAPAAFARRKR